MDPAGNRTEWTLDAAGNARVTTRIEALPDGGSVTTSSSASYDALGRTLRRLDGLGNPTELAYDARGNVIRAIDAEGYLTVSEYDGLDRMTRSVRPEGISIDYGYDKSGRLRTYTDALDQTTQYQYDALDRRTTTTYPDTRTETVGYDGAGNAETLVDGLGTTVVQVFDDANRLTQRTVTPAAGVEGPLAESFGYDGLSRLTSASSGGLGTTMAYDSLSRMTSETTNGRTVAFELDEAGNRTLETYPSGLAVGRTYDPLNRPESVDTATYGYRGPDLVAEKTRGSLHQTLLYDAARRLVEANETGAAGAVAHAERLAWTPRSLKAAIARGEVPGASLLLGYDGAGRLTRAANLPGAASSIPNNSTPAEGLFAQATESFGFGYDPAENLLVRTETKSSVEMTTSLPLDGSGRNRPGAVDGRTIEWDANGNLTRKGEVEYHYDFRNRLTRVTRGAAEVARYRYDAFNRRIETIEGGETRETVWSGWRPIETRSDTGFTTRRVYGVGLDEIVRQEVDVDGDGTAETEHFPVYDSTGSLVAVLDPDGKPIERYEYSPYGEQTIRADLVEPEVEQVRVVGGEVWFEVTERVSYPRLLNLVTTGDLRIENLTTSTPVEIATLVQPVELGRQARRRFVLELAGPPALGDQVRLVIPVGALEDEFLNRNTEEIQEEWTWTGIDEVVFDDRPPEITEVRIYEGRVELEFTEEVDPQSANTTVAIDGAQTGWELDEDRYTLRSILGVSPLSHTVEIVPGIEDVAGLANTETRTVDFPASAADRIGYYRPDPSVVPTSTASNRYGFHGLELDQATGLVYMRNRWYDPELGRFVTADPMGYPDGANRYEFAGGAPLLRADPLGLYQTDFHYYVVYWMSWLALSDPDTVHRIALASQFTDDSSFTSPLPEPTRNIWEPHYWKRLRAFHFVSSTFGPVVRNNSLVRYLGFSSVDRASATGLGIALHSIADSFSHEGFSAYPGTENWRNPQLRSVLRVGDLPSIGHIEALTEPDLPFASRDAAEKAADAALTVYEMVWEFGDRVGKGKKRLSDEELSILHTQLAHLFLHFSARSTTTREGSWFIHLRGLGLPVPRYSASEAQSVLRAREFQSEAMTQFRLVERNAIATIP